MKDAFKIAYERELALLKERAAAFALENPGLAERLGGLLEENLDPSIAGLLEGSAFMAARVQLNIDQQFRTFSRELLEQLFPDATAPLPSAMMVRAAVPGKPGDVAEGREIPVGAYIDSSFSQAERRTTCRYRLAEPLMLWPFAIPEATYHSSATPLNALGCDTPSGDQNSIPRTEAGLVFTLKRGDGGPLEELTCDSLPIQFTGAMREAMALYEQVFSQLTRITLRWEDRNGDPVLRRLPPEVLAQVGFGGPALFGHDELLFPGISTLLEYYAFPRKFLGMIFTDLSRHLRGIKSHSVQVIFEFSAVNSHLSTRFSEADLGLYCAPAVNLFEDDAQPITLNNRHHRYPVTPNRTPVMNYEVHRVLGVRAQYEGNRERVDVLPLYALPKGHSTTRQTLYYTLERDRRRLTSEELRAGGVRYRYEGTETWITLYQPPEQDEANLLFLRTLCSNRHLPEILPIADATFQLLEDRSVHLKPVAAPTKPREAASELDREAGHRNHAGDNYWRLISLLNLSQRGFTGRDGSGNIEALREVLRLFSDVSDQVTQAHINAVHAMNVRPITRTLRRPDGYHSARGIEIRLTLDETVIDSGGMITLSAILDRFFADYAAVNSFTQLTLLDRTGKLHKTWPPRSGSGPLL
ncbi:type VI secretion system baseplate subunit TssF [Celeribacter sp.]|uniref:type VI secretion system baseplate subunit TssF n=1 Tax=Celeribacter sp. TaxID=1890673 RepID=UPI003A91AAF7